LISGLGLSIMDATRKPTACPNPYRANRRLKRCPGGPTSGDRSGMPGVPARAAGVIHIDVPLLTKCAPVCPLSHSTGQRNTFGQPARSIAVKASMWRLPSLVLGVNAQRAAKTLAEDNRHLAFSSLTIREAQAGCSATPVELRSATFHEGHVRHYAPPAHR
jgi:hypothetical protein